ncbi:MAG: sigma-54-dependent Fis family transcriptional regulator [Gammaproteobacteria bacterium]|nr:sigma-54-dependent Fis family transcriptional regulator [Gammaproteobacteria bacterium]
MTEHAKSKPSCEQIIDILPDPFVVIDRDFRIIAANRNYLKHYGYSRSEEVVGRYCYEVSHRVDAPCSQHGEHCPLETVFETGQASQVMHIHYDRQGGEEHVQLHSNPLFGDDGEVLYVGEYIYPVSKPGDESLLIGRSRPMLRLSSLLQRVAPTQTSVLLLGESGVGKECVAQYLHQYSTRAGMPLVIVDCGTLGENLIESELFGHEKGAFTGASARKKGLFEMADGGTLLIDEIGELPLSLQTKLLRVLETGTFRRLGGTEYIRVNVRVLAATNKNLKEMSEQGTFRQDLYYRLSAFPVHIPPLRQRADDIPALAEHFLANIEDGDRFVPIPPDVIEVLLGYEYPGNVRELRNIVERAAILAFGEELLRPEHIVFEDDNSNNVNNNEFSPDDFVISNNNLIRRRNGRLNEEAVMRALVQSNGHRANAAQLLGVSERTLYRYVQRLRENT